MSKAGMSTMFRKVDVDQFNEDNFQDEVVEEAEDQGPNESEVNALLSQKKNLEALKLVLSNPPLATKNQAVKDRAFNTVIRVLTIFRSSEVEVGVKSLDRQKIDVLMKYIYRGLECPTENSCGILLVWHEKAFAEGGLGSIVRVLTDRKKV